MAASSAPVIDVQYVANLARLDLSPAEVTQFQARIPAILDYVRLLQEVDVTGVEPTAHATRMHNIWAADNVVASPDNAPLLANAPDLADEVYIKVPVVLGGDSEGAP